MNYYNHENNMCHVFFSSHGRKPPFRPLLAPCPWQTAQPIQQRSLMCLQTCVSVRLPLRCHASLKRCFPWLRLIDYETILSHHHIGANGIYWQVPNYVFNILRKPSDAPWDWSCPGRLVAYEYERQLKYLFTSKIMNRLLLSSWDQYWCDSLWRVSMSSLVYFMSPSVLIPTVLKPQ